jgi:hypothetical protein
MDNVRNCGSYINIPSSKTYRSYLLKKSLENLEEQAKNTQEQTLAAWRQPIF